MAIWEIRIMDQPPIRLDAAPERNLAVEFETLLSKPQPWYARWFRIPVYWRITREVSIRAGIVIAIQPLFQRKEKRPAKVGFRTTPTPKESA